jgi:hypothetical protein
MGVFFRSENFFRTTREIEYFFFCRAKREFFFQYLTLDYITKTLNQIIFFPPPNIGKLNGPSLMNDTDVERTSVLGFKFTKYFDLQRFVFLIVVKLTEEIMFN